ncbi:hypothetical protein U1E44_01635 [Arenibacter sp. GZD96]|uniref:hypothetical protein n=1 Tax=Aurantibrevibacter litoralis TaxID=3106030 RepID=UPI002AFF17ED|nr:hypothetical protein [Arenibacter sp. GZD-96]MEA1784780.1 hypothetical protein [Arenibacter sp. GZD-96]
MEHIRLQIRSALCYFLLAAALGFILRLFYVVELPVTYRYLVHAHSHIALLGWVYLTLTALIYGWFVRNTAIDTKYGYLFWGTQITLVGMLFSFPFQGYALFSIIFSTLFLFASYAFTWLFLKNVQGARCATNSYRCIRMALGYMVLSSIGPWVLGGIMATLGTDSVWYRMAIYFYLHFQYNGWMLLGLLGLFIFVLEQHQIELPPKGFKWFYWCFNWSIILSFFLSTLWAKPHFVFYLLGCLGAILQVAALVLFLKMLSKTRPLWRTFLTQFQHTLGYIFAVLLTVKISLQLLTAFPYFADLAATYTDFTIGYLHWTFLGVVSIGLFLLLDYGKWIHISKNIFRLYFIGFVGTEGLIMYKGLAAWLGFGLPKGYFNMLVVGSALIVLSLVLLLLQRTATPKEQVKGT